MEAEEEKEHPKVTIEDVNRLLEVGRLLFSVMTPAEIEDLQQLMLQQASRHRAHVSAGQQIGNAGVT